MRLTFSRGAGIWLFLGLAVVIGIAAILVPRVDLPPAYHHFADQRRWLGIPNFGDVASNVVFLLAGVGGLAFFVRHPNQQSFEDPRERWPYVFVFLGLILTAFGSAYYHLAPDDSRLVWDRLPMTIVFMPLVSTLIAERANLKLGLYLLPLLIVVGIASVIHWRWTVLLGAGDLRFYGAVQLYAVLALFAALLLPARYTRGSDLLVVAGFYALAKVCETADREIYSVGHIVSGHTLKHLAAGLAGLWILRMLQKRQLIQDPSGKLAA